MPAKKKALNTPLQLLQELSNSLLVHFDKACRQAVAEAESALAKLEKQRGKAQDKLLKARARLDEAGSAGKSKAQAKARNRIEELESSMALLQERQGEMLTYLAELKRDVATATGLARGIQEVETAVGRAMQPAAAKAASPKATTTAAKRPAASAKAAASKPTSSARAPAKPAAAKRAPGKAAASSAANSKAAPASTAKPKPTPAKPAGTKAPAGSKVAASKAGGSTKAATAKKPSARKPARPASKAPETAATEGAQPDASAS